MWALSLPTIGLYSTISQKYTLSEHKILEIIPRKSFIWNPPIIGYDTESKTDGSKTSMSIDK